ncbi:unnamed protein product [Darwinula stevensoni]|uniref:tRNA-splicing endonuclease subunit Sen54 N-terminal domain-containing protein n=1 Tax=Darwinula stevensoni TaxID=69355 RepID=A0A7R8X898_9CRUS|nr:unnamed protein product [Darwinula stevensoni]CAG0884216.1 unnamed protein product [Darwinula stevensoni]
MIAYDTASPTSAALATSPNTCRYKKTGAAEIYQIVAQRECPGEKSAMDAEQGGSTIKKLFKEFHVVTVPFSPPLTISLSGVELAVEALRGREELDLLNPGIKGPKLNFPGGSWLEAKEIQQLLDQRKAVLAAPCIYKLSDVILGEYNPELGLVMLKKTAGKKWGYMGLSLKSQTYLYPEEAIFLMEMKMMELVHEGIPISTQRAFNLLLTSCDSLEQYKVYAYLSQEGYKVMRYRSRDVTWYEKRIRLHTYQHKREKKPVPIQMSASSQDSVHQESFLSLSSKEVKQHEMDFEDIETVILDGTLEKPSTEHVIQASKCKNLREVSMESLPSVQKHVEIPKSAEDASPVKSESEGNVQAESASNEITAFSNSEEREEVEVCLPTILASAAASVKISDDVKETEGKSEPFFAVACSLEDVIEASLPDSSKPSNNDGEFNDSSSQKSIEVIEITDDLEGMSSDKVILSGKSQPGLKDCEDVIVLDSDGDDTCAASTLTQGRQLKQKKSSPLQDLVKSCAPKRMKADTKQNVEVITVLDSPVFSPPPSSSRDELLSIIPNMYGRNRITLQVHRDILLPPNSEPIKDEYTIDIAKMQAEVREKVAKTTSRSQKEPPKPSSTGFQRNASLQSNFNTSSNWQRYQRPPLSSHQFEHFHSQTHFRMESAPGHWSGSSYYDPMPPFVPMPSHHIDPWIQEHYPPNFMYNYPPPFSGRNSGQSGYPPPAQQHFFPRAAQPRHRHAFIGQSHGHRGAWSKYRQNAHARKNESRSGVFRNQDKNESYESAFPRIPPEVESWRKVKIKLKDKEEKETLTKGPLKSLWNGTVKPLIEPKDAVNVGTVLRQIDVGPTATNSAEIVQEESLSSDEVIFDIHLPTVTVKRHHPPEPLLRVFLLPTRHETMASVIKRVQAWQRERADEVPIVVARCVGSSVQFFHFRDFVLPSPDG